ncbi:MAG: DUF4976 domain-containing protein [Verrucomicrobia bacterium]|nr:MAG: DUF4976 domain-containing protein [Verrucomicrobiota bacterium]
MLAGAAALAMAWGLPARAARPAKPNILWIMADDHAAHAIGAYGGRLAALNPTPNIDRLAAEGVLLRNAFVVDSICTPCRATLITGQYPHVHGVRTLQGRIEPARQFLPQLMRQAGYTTAMIGKWHLGEEPAAFDYYAVLPVQGWYFNPVFRVKGRGPWPKNEFRFQGYNSKHVTEAITDLSLRWLKNRDKSKPFFLMHHFKAPHDNFENAERYDWDYADVEIPEPESLWNQPDFGSAALEGLGTSIGKRYAPRNMGQHMFVDPALPDDEYKHVAYQRYLKKYLRCVKGIDDQIGRLLAYLKETGELDNTIIFYTSDQGMMLGEHDFMDKRWMYEESMRVPFIVRYPRELPAGVKRDAMVANVDFAPTILDFAGVATPPYMQGRSFRAILNGSAPDRGRHAVYYRYWMHLTHHANPAHYGIRTDRYKLIFYYALPLDAEGAIDRPTTPAWEFYDLARDPHEMHNRYGDPAYADVIRELKQELLRLKREVGDTDERYPELMEVRERLWDQ